MTVSHSKALELLGKEISFSVILKDEIKEFHPMAFWNQVPLRPVLICVSGDHEILVGDVFYLLNEIEMK